MGPCEGHRARDRGSILRGVLNRGEATGIIGRSPIPRRAVRQLETEPLDFYLEPGEWREFVGTARVTPEGKEFVPLLRVLLRTGSRIGERAELRWRAVDLGRRTLLVRQAKVHGRPKLSR